jgi:hypothetical protein
LTQPETSGAEDPQPELFEQIGNYVDKSGVPPKNRVEAVNGIASPLRIGEDPKFQTPRQAELFAETPAGRRPTGPGAAELQQRKLSARLRLERVHFDLDISDFPSQPRLHVVA